MMTNLDTINEQPVVQEYIEHLRNSRKSPAVLKTRLVNLRSSRPGCIVFAFEGDDDKAAYSQWVRRIRHDLSYEPFVCDGKSGVFDLFDIVERDRGKLKEGIFFFVDRDFDDLRGRTPDPSIFMTDQYSIENYLVTEATLDELLKDDFHCNESPALREEIIPLFRRVYDEFLDVTSELNFRIFVARKRPMKLANSLPSAIRRLATVNLRSVDVGTDDAATLAVWTETPRDDELAAFRTAFDPLDRKSRYRGKFCYLFFVKWLLVLADDRREQTRDVFHSVDARTVNTAAATAIGPLASKSPFPTGLREFISGV